MKRQLALIFGLMFMFGLSQEKRDFQWWNPAEQDIPVIEGQAWPKEVEQFYDRLPARARHSVSSDVWGLSKESAGLMIRFRSNSREIKVKYQLRNIQNYALNHMPATGVSGLDLYAITSDGEELWYAGQRRFGDSTVTYTFANVRPNDKYHKLGREYRLFLPLYNQVMDLEIGTKPDTYFEVLPVRKDKPIVVYGTSIAQGACASRPGMAWTALLGRKMDRPLVNLGFSGSGRLDTAVIDLLTEIDAKIYILDCMPNLTQNVWGSLGIEDDLAFKERILNAVGLLRAEKPDTPILLAEHAGFSDEDIHPDKQKMAQNVNAIQRQA
ncbi:MAG: SGNH/GDSL hydrolase family protein, partial [Bacteroidota bacterium]